MRKASVTGANTPTWWRTRVRSGLVAGSISVMTSNSVASMRLWLRPAASDCLHGHRHPLSPLGGASVATAGQTDSGPSPSWRLEDERHEHLGRALVEGVGVWELPGQIALLDRRAVDEVHPGQAHGDEPHPAQRHGGTY